MKTAMLGLTESEPTMPTNYDGGAEPTEGRDDPNADSAKAIIEDGAIVIRVQLSALQQIMDGGFACAAYDQRYKVTDPEGFAKEIAAELNDENEEGSTPVHKLFDAAINEALNQGAQHAEPHEIQEF